MIETGGEPEVLNSPDGESQDDYEEEAIEELSGEILDEVILEKGGIHFINSKVLNPDRETEKDLDADFRKLVDSVIKD
jgi:hypothetical protein